MPKMDHKREMRPTEILGSYCLEEGCEFQGTHAVQGHCYASEGDLADFSKLEKLEREQHEELVEIRAKHYPDVEEYITWLESMYECAMINWHMTLDECVRLRRDNTLLRKGQQK